MSCSDWIGILGVIVSTFLGGLAIWQNHEYKKQSEKFTDLQFMPEFFLVENDGYIGMAPQDGMNEVTSMGYGYTQNLGKYAAVNAPIYDLSISEVTIDGNRVDTDGEAQSKTVNIYPTNPYFRIHISIPKGIIRSPMRHKGIVLLTYESMYGVKYKKQISFIYQFKAPGKAVHSREIKSRRAERYKNG